MFHENVFNHRRGWFFWNYSKEISAIQRNYSFDKKDDDDLTERTLENYPLQEMEDYLRMKFSSSAPCIFISAKNKTNIDELKEAVYREAKRIHTERYPYDDLLYEEVE